MKYFLAVIVTSAPSLALASSHIRNFSSLVDVFIDIISLLVPLVFSLTFIVLMWGIIKAWILNAGDTAEIEKGKKLVIVGIIVLVIMSGIWGILALLRSSLFGV